MKIAYIIPTLNHGGAEHQLYRLVRGLDRDAFDVTVYCLRTGGPIEPLIAKLGIPVLHVNRRRKTDVWSIVRLASWLRRLKPDIVHTWLPTASIWGRLSAIMAGCTTIIASERTVDPARSLPRRLLDRALARRTAAIIVNATAVRKSYAGATGVPHEKLATIPNGVDIEHIDDALRRAELSRKQMADELGFPKKALIVGTVARVTQAKGLEDFVSVAALVCQKLPDARFIIVGGAVYGEDRKYMRRIEEHASEAGLDGKLAITGLRDDPIPYLLGMDVFLQTSVQEGLPNGVMEAMVCEVPVVATDVGGTRELMDGASEYLAPAGDVNELAGKVVDLLQRVDERESVGRAAAARMRSSFSVEKMVDATQELYRRTVANSKAAA